MDYVNLFLSLLNVIIFIWLHLRYVIYIKDSRIRLKLLKEAVISSLQLEKRETRPVSKTFSIPYENEQSIILVN